ncbi:acetyl-CoA carboxylase biotin carboxylase subunit [Paenisporosarcina cavernae]|uniref:biotin carboxylase n=1 Tax=Paenisporosarcina cavernae TaxID=2320858 RepID=A0A385YR08_9BACL|nr:biotin carboxylase N-terminal domain-containing protein [Paenisporosarcina cavernae]AYC29149.1 ATP-grasp domain-containing protein [Paenisporosarcina cavernae]
MKKILIANRGEIARRIIQTCKRLGVQTVAVYSEADAELPFVKEADEAFLIGPAAVNASYLNVDEILRVAQETKVDGIHPGYGLLSENATFAKRVKEAGISFIGPAPETMDLMGDKIGSRKTMIAAGVPVVPGTEEGVASLEEAIVEAEKIGYPLMLKASSGGGGIGMVKCENEQALSQHFESIKKRAQSYFGDDKVFLEKFIENGRHIEVQVFGDTHGNVVHLYERNCSVQRRNQKVIEESPSPNFPKEAAEKLWHAAVEAAKAVNYKNAGTVEFIVDANHAFYFLEMNTRLQVEHPVTESITGQDLVEWQLKIASGEELPIKNQADIPRSGHAMEFRIYAEDPKTFFPSPGTISTLKWGTENVRIDSGFEEGNTVTPYYDPMIAKVIVESDSREDVLAKAKGFFDQTDIQGLKTNVPFFQHFFENERFQSGDYTTKVIPDWLAQK